MRDKLIRKAVGAAEDDVGTAAPEVRRNRSGYASLADTNFTGQERRGADRRAANINKLEVEAVFFKKSRVEGYPDVDLAGRDGGDRHPKLFGLAFGGAYGNYRKQSETEKQLQHG